MGTIQERNIRTFILKVSGTTFAGNAVGHSMLVSRSVSLSVLMIRHSDFSTASSSLSHLTSNDS